MPPQTAHRRRSRLGPAVRGGALVAFCCSLGLLLLGCSRSNLRADLDRGNRSDSDLVALLPRGLELLVDLDVSELRRLDSAEPLLALLPSSLLTPLSAVGGASAADILHSLDALTVGLSGLGSGSGPPTVVWLARGLVARPRLTAELRRRGASSEVEYHGMTLLEPGPRTQPGQPGQPDQLATASIDTALLDEPPPLPGETPPPVSSELAARPAAALLTAHTAVLGSPVTVRQVIDIFRSDDEGARSQSELMAALGRAPRAKEGRPALLAALLLTPALRERLSQLHLFELSPDAEFVALSLAVGDGLDLGLVVGYRQLASAEQAAAALLQKSRDLRSRPGASLLGLGRALEPLIAVAAPANLKKGRLRPELHVGYRLPGDDLQQLLERLSKLKQLPGLLPAPPRPPRP